MSFVNDLSAEAPQSQHSEEHPDSEESSEEECREYQYGQQKHKFRLASGETGGIAKELGRFIASKSSTFTCSGSIKISRTDTAGPPASPPITLRWDSAEACEKIIFPITDDHGRAQLAKLAADCQPASFGYKGENVVDESYRKATKLDRSMFASDFCPYELGIIDTITQMLLPNVERKFGLNGVKAELYKLNIYAAPSGFFKAHVDTPRSEIQFGSLVISLPCQHEGGQLIIRHANHSVVYDWGTSKSGVDSINWAAFYSDCEHEVQEITEGLRVTLTYNLYFTAGVGDLAPSNPIMHSDELPLYGEVQRALRNAEFMKSGGHLGIFCSHAYAHTTAEGGDALPGVLKGSDMAVFAVFKALGLEIKIQAVLDDTRAVADLVEDKKYQREWDRRNETKEPGSECSDTSSTAETDPGDLPFNRFATVGSLVTGTYSEEGSEDLLKNWPHKVIDTTWLRPPQKKLKHDGYVSLRYGNEAYLEMMYTYACMLIRIPPSSERAI